MSQVAEGTVGFIKENPQSRGILYSFVLNAPGASKEEKGTWYNTGNNKPPCQKGDSVKFAYTTNAKGYHDADVTKFKVTGAAPPVSHKGASAGGFKATAGAKDDYWAKKEEREHAVTQPMIMFQNATTNAVNVVTTGFQTGTLDLGKTKAKQVDNLMILVRKIRSEIFTDYILKQESLINGDDVIEREEDSQPKLADEAKPEGPSGIDPPTDVWEDEDTAEDWDV